MSNTGWLVDLVGPEPTVAGAGLLLLAATLALAGRGWFGAMDGPDAGGQPQPSEVVPASRAASQPSASGHQRQAGPGR